MARQIAEKLLRIHIEDEKRVQKIVKAITSDICVHGYPIVRDEATDIGLEVLKPEPALEKDMWGLYEYYAKKMALGTPFRPLEILGEKETAKFKHPGACVESVNLSDQFAFKGKVRRTIRDNKPVVDINIEHRGWEVVK